MSGTKVRKKQPIGTLKGHMPASHSFHTPRIIQFSTSGLLIDSVLTSHTSGHRNDVFSLARLRVFGLMCSH